MFTNSSNFECSTIKIKGSGGKICETKFSILKMDKGIVSLDDLESVAVKVLPKNALDYFRSGAEDMVTLKDNREAFKRSVFHTWYIMLYVFLSSV